MKIIDLENIQTKNTSTNQVNGRFIPIYKDYQNIYDIVPEFIYMSACDAGEIKGPHLHKERCAYFTCVKGEVVFISKEGDVFKEVIINALDAPKTVYIPPNIPCVHINLGIEEAIIINVCAPAWRPDNQDNFNVEFEDYNWEKWTEYLDSKKKFCVENSECIWLGRCSCGVEEFNKKLDNVKNKLEENLTARKK